MKKLEPILDYDLGEPDDELYQSEVGNRLEYVQRKRLRLLQAMEHSVGGKLDQIASDEGLSITYTSTLRDFEKQELAKHKSRKEEEMGDKNAVAAAFAADFINQYRKASRAGEVQSEVKDVDIPKVSNELDDVQPDALAMSDRQFKEMDYDSFRKGLIESGVDKFHRIDENGKIVPITTEKEDG